MSSISVVIPTYKASPFIRETLASVFTQTRLPDEVIVVDDCSPDETVAVVEEFVKASPIPLRVIRLPKNTGGPARPLNVGIEAARGQLIATLDHDDRMTPNRLADQLDVYNFCPDVGMILGRLRGTRSLSERDSLTHRGWDALQDLPKVALGPTTYRVSAGDAHRAVLEHGCYALTCSCMLLPKSVWQAVGGFDERIRTSCDLDILQALTRFYAIAYTTAVVGEWSAPPSTLYSASGLRRRFQDYWIVLDRFRERGLTGELKPLWQKKAREFLFEHGYSFRKCGDLRMAALCQIRAARVGGVTGDMLKEFVKIAKSLVLPCQRRAAL